jgi:hypothetical protein
VHRLGLRALGEAEANRSQLADRAQAAAEVDLPALWLLRQAPDLGRALAPQRDVAAGDALGEDAQRDAAQRRVGGGEHL